MESGMTLEKLRVIIEAYTKPYRDEMDKIRQKTAIVTAQVERETAKMRNSYKKVAAVTASVLSIAGIVAFGKSCIELGSDLQEVQNVVDVTFGDMSRQVDLFSKNAIKQFGLSELAAKEYMGTYGSMAKSFGFDTREVYDLSSSITGLTGDLASFRNLTTDEAYIKLKSIFTGETESLKEIGVVMTQTALDQYALNEGLGKTTANMTEQEKVMLRYRFVMSSLSDASGDFARTSKSWANQVRILQLQFESLKATIGQGLINVLTPVIQVINTIIAKLQTLASYFKAFTVALFGDAGDGASDSMASVAGSSGTIADNMNTAAGAAKKLKEYTLGIDELNVLRTDDESGSSGGSGAGIADFGSISGELFEDVTVNQEIEAAAERIRATVERLKEVAQPTTEALSRLWDEGLAKLGTFTWTTLKDFWNYFLVPLGTWGLGEGLPRFLDITNDFLSSINWNKINEALVEFWKALEPFAENIGNGLLWFYENVMKPFGEWAIGTALPEVIELIASALEAVNKIAGVVGPILSDLYHVILEPFGEWVGDVLIDALRGWKKAFEEIGDLISTHEELAAALTGIAIGIGLISLAMNANPFMIIGAGLTAVAVGIGYAIEHWDEIVKAFSNGWKDIASFFTGGWNSIKSWWEESALVVWWREDVFPWFTKQKWLDLLSSVRASFDTTWAETLNTWKRNLSTWWKNDVSPWFTLERWIELYSSISKSLVEIWEQTKGEWKLNVDSWWNNDVATWFTAEKWKSVMREIPTAFGSVFKDAVNAGVEQLNKLIDWVNEKLNFSFDGYEILGEEVIPAFNIQLFRIPHIPTFASGGFPSTGQLFIANEAGPELVGRYGSRTGVMNNDQIVSAVSEGVANAVANVMAAFENNNDSSEPIEVVVNLDGRTISKSVQKADRRGGFRFRPT